MNPGHRARPWVCWLEVDGVVPKAPGRGRCDSNVRGGQQSTVKVTLGERPQQQWPIEERLSESPLPAGSSASPNRHIVESGQEVRFRARASTPVLVRSVLNQGH